MKYSKIKVERVSLETLYISSNDASNEPSVIALHGFIDYPYISDALINRENDITRSSEKEKLIDEKYKKKDYIDMDYIAASISRYDLPLIIQWRLCDRVCKPHGV